jgi:uncharacterized protein (DUF1778 family)
MARSTETISLTLRPATVKALDAAALGARRSRSQFVDLTLEKALTGKGRLEALQSIADAGLREYAAEHARERGPNATEVIAASSTEGFARLRALNEIAAPNRKAAK